MVVMSNHSLKAIRWLLLSVIAAGILGGCGEMRPVGSRGDLVIYTVKPGDTLYSISWRYGYDHREVAAWNSIPPPFNIYPGQELLIISPYQAEPREPQATNTSQATGAATAPATTVPQAAAAVSRPAQLASTAAMSKSRDTSPGNLENSGQSLQSMGISWRWPTNGNVRSKYAPSDGKKGLDIEGKIGQPIYAAAGGKVVYSGNGLIGYGNLVIIKHNNHYLSAYGHNRRLLVKEGNEVKQGEKIAEMGDSGKDGIILHFEIRRDGKPVDPLHYLPKQDS